MPVIEDVAICEAEVPLLRSFATSRDVLVRQVTRLVRIALRLSNGVEGVGEAVPVHYVTGETQTSVRATLDSVAPKLCGADPDRPLSILAETGEQLRDAPAARAGLEMALLDAHLTSSGSSLWSWCGGVCEEVETDVTLPLVEDAAERAVEYARMGFRHFKVKLGRPSPADDLAVLRRVAELVPDAGFRLDANQSHSADSALSFIDECLRSHLPVECMEQPVPATDLEALDAVAAGSAVPIIADEAVRTPEDAYRVLCSTCVHGLNVKLMKSGILGARDIVAIAKAAGRRLMIGCMLETPRGIAAALALACGSGAFDYVDLDAHMLVDLPVGDAFVQTGPVLRVSRR